MNAGTSSKESWTEICVPCPAHQKGQVIGPRGATIRQLQQDSGATVTLSNTEPTCLIRGTASQTAAAQAALHALLNPPFTSLTCASTYVGQLIGPRGATIRQLQESTGARIEVNSKVSPCSIRISGATQRIVDACVSKVQDIVHPIQIQLLCTHPNFLGQLIGPGGATIRRLQDSTGARIDVDSRATPPVITITGNTAAVRNAAKRRVLSIIEPPQATVHCTSNKRLGRLIGPKGTTIKLLQERTHTKINVNDNTGKSGGVRVDISGAQMEAVEQARQLVAGILTPLTLDISAPKDIASALIGDGGENIEALRHHCNAMVDQHMLYEQKVGAQGTVEHKTQQPSDYASKVQHTHPAIDPLASYVEVELLGAWHDNDERTVTVQLESNNQEALDRCSAIVQHEIDAAVRGQDYTGAEGKELRQQANAWSMERSALLELSQKAYRLNCREEAKEYAEQAKLMGAKMVATNVLARNAIYQHRNAGTSENFLDLHGLYVQEALYYLTVVLQAFLKNGVEDRLECVTGAGHHSPLGISKIKRAVHDVVQRLGLRVEIKNEGSYIIYC